MEEAHKTNLTSIKGGRTNPRSGRRESLSESEQVYCYICSNTIGIETSAVVQVVIAPRRSPDGRKTGGTKVWACAHCLARGEITELIQT